MAKLIYQAITKLQQTVIDEKNDDLKAKLATQVQNLQKILTNQDITSDNETKVASDVKAERSYTQILKASSGATAANVSTSGVQMKKATGQAHMSPGHGKSQSSNQLPKEKLKTSYREKHLILANSKAFPLVNALELRIKLNFDFT
ncbi:hypothetical protein VTO42DRAFT_4682 [Malbranchea cinnamomea]